LIPIEESDGLEPFQGRFVSIWYTCGFFGKSKNEMSAEQLIVGRLICELRRAARVALGPGLPRRVIPYLSPEQSWVDLGCPRVRAEDVDLALVEAVEVSESGSVAVTVGTNVTSINADTWIASGMLRAQNGRLQMLKVCTLPTQVSRGVSLVVTELGVIRVSEIGFELLEISPGVGSDDVRRQVRASLHVADDVKRIQRCA
jgi:hypothetical protein